jgi:hypothetical protein
VSIAAASSQTALLGRAQTVALSAMKSAADQQVALLSEVADQSKAATEAAVASAGTGRGQLLDLLA